MRISKNAYDAVRGIFLPPISEEMVLREIVDRLWLEYAIKVWRIRERIPVKGKRWQQLSTAGLPDLFGHVHNDSGEGHAIPLYIECKRPGGVRREAQRRFINQATSDGCIALFAEKYEDVVEALAAHGIHGRSVALLRQLQNRRE